jgi:CRISPR-associated protein Csd1
MFLQRLVEYARRLDLPPPLYVKTPVRYIIELDGAGRPLSSQPTDTADPASRADKRGVPREVPQVVRTSAVKPLLLADGADYVLGLMGPTGKAARVAQAHQAFVQLIERCAAATDEPAVRAVAAFLQGDPLSQLELGETFDPDALITFRVDGRFPVDLPAVQSFWALENDPEAQAAGKESGPVIMQCLICGQRGPVLHPIPGKIKRVPGGQTSGTALISANADAFYSYGLEGALIAPTCPSCGELFTKGLNALIADEHTHLGLGGAVFIFWTREPTEFDVVTMFSNPDQVLKQVRELIDAARGGQIPAGLVETDFYAAALSGSGARVVVRDWLDTTVHTVAQQMGRWFLRQEIIGVDGGPGRPLGLFALAASTVRDARKDLAPPTARALLRAALTGGPVPIALLQQAVRRNAVEGTVTHARAALIKLMLLSNHFIQEEDAMTQLDLSNTTPAYLCGRLLAVLEQAQRQAIPGLNTTLVDRYYGTASSAPATVFGTLLGGVQAHLSKLERDRPGAYHALQRRLEEILSGLQGFPLTLKLQDQALFALGYYHQRAADRAGAQAHRDRQTSDTSTPATTESFPIPEEEANND